MRYISTRGGGEPLRFGEILLEGLATDGGLYVPKLYPRLNLNKLRGASYREVALAVLAQYASDIPFQALRRIIEKTYTPAVFGTKEITPLKWLEPGLALLQLSNGPTLAFKDVALQLVGALMEYELELRGKQLNILGATSGDTGSAAAYALRGKGRLRLFMLSPYGRMSAFQAKQMYTLADEHIFNLVADVPFDDLQAVVKVVNADAEFKEDYHIGAVNSINWARVAAQVVYYVYAYLQATTDNAEQVDFAVPSGNFGNAFSAHVARQMGVPIRRIIVATNENDVLREFFETGIYRVRRGDEVKSTSSPSMDIAAASNFERLVFDTADADPNVVVGLWNKLKEKGQFDGTFMRSEFRSSWRTGRANEAEVNATIHDVYQRYGVVIDPHTAVSMHVGLQHRTMDVPLIVAETAQPAKFAGTIRAALGFEPPVPPGYEGLDKLKERVFRVEPNAEAVKQFIATHV